MIDPSVLVTGAGGLVGSMAMEYLVRSPHVKRVIATDVNKKRLENYAKSAMLGGMLHGFYPKVTWQVIDLTDVESFASFLKKEKPGIILNCTTMISSFWYTDLINYAIKKSGKTFPGRLAGHTFAKDCVLTYKIAQAIEQADMPIKFVNISFPDHTNYALGKVGLAPTTGAGTIDLTVEATRYVVSKKLDVPANNVFIRMIAHHGLRAAPVTKDLFWIRIDLNGEDITKEFDTVELIKEALPYSGGYNHGATASSGVKTVLGLITDSGVYTHLPGVKGVCGGYPARLTVDGPEILLPKEVSRAQAEQINETGMIADGIQRVDDQGTVYFTAKTRELLEEFLGISRKYVRLDELMTMTKELRAGYMKLEEQFKKDKVHL
ncbi:MAG: saccharopine dehydrogenase NADP-binding domain-containing protein [Candidatus Ranarchaeia archaeon]